MCSNFYLKTPDDKHWLAQDNGRDVYVFKHKVDGYTKEQLTEKQFQEIYKINIL